MLAMTRPYKHPKTGIYWLRKRVPLDLQALVGKREEKLSLKTRDHDVAKTAASRALIDIDARWAMLRKGPQTLSAQEASVLAEEVYRFVLDQHRLDPAAAADWDVEIGGDLWATLAPYEIDWNAGDRLIAQFVPTKPFERAAMIASCEQTADALLSRRGMRVDAVSRDRLVRTVASAIQQASVEAIAAQKPVFVKPAVNVRHAPEKVGAGRRDVGTEAVKLQDIYDGWVKESCATERTRYAWSRVVRELAQHLGHERANDITQRDLVAWKDSLLEKDLASKTIKDGKLAPIRAILKWGVKNGKLDANAAEHVTVNLKKKPGEKKRGYDDEQAFRILSEAWRQDSPSFRWVPWICATSGARISEVCQLRKKDVLPLKDVLCFKITGEAGSLKTVSSERDIPVHSALLKLGFASFIKEASDGPLFPDLPADRFGNRGGTASKRIGKWVRGMGIIDKRLSPNHAWRHRFSSLERKYGVDPTARPALTGHAQKTEDGEYGDHDALYLKRELEKIPLRAFAPATFWNGLTSIDYAITSIKAVSASPNRKRVRVRRVVDQTATDRLNHIR